MDNDDKPPKPPDKHSVGNEKDDTDAGAGVEHQHVLQQQASVSDKAASVVRTDHGPAILNIAVEIVQAVAAQSSDQGPAEVEDQAYVGTQLSTGTSYSTGAVVTTGH